MTKREIYSTVVTNFETNENEKTEFEVALYELAQKEIAAIDAQNARSAAKRAEKHEADEPLKNAILEGLAKDVPTTTADVGAAIGVSTPKASYLLRTLVEEGKILAHDVMVKGKGKCKGYTLA